MIYKNCDIEVFWNSCKKDIIVFGTSNIAVTLMNEMIQQNQCRRVLYFVDNDSTLWGQKIRFKNWEYVIENPEILRSEERDICVMIASTYVYDIAVQLEGYRTLENRECYFYPFMKWRSEYDMDRYLEKTKMLHYKYREQGSKFAEIKNSHKGERCFIVGNGPSLEMKDLELLIEEFCFGANQIFFAFEKTNWRPDVYLTVNADTLFAYYDIIDELPCELKIIDGKALDYGIEIKNALYLRHGNYMKDEALFSEDISNYYYNGSTVVYTALQVAAYMGFKEIYLIGVDNNYAVEKKASGEQVKNDIQNHFYKDEEDDKTAGLYATANVDHLIQSFLIAKEYADKNGIKIYNATRGGKLEVFPRITLEDALEIKKENL